MTAAHIATVRTTNNRRRSCRTAITRKSPLSLPTCSTEDSSGRDSRQIQANRESLRRRIVWFMLNVGFMPATPVARGVQASSWQLGANWAHLRISAKKGSRESDCLCRMRPASVGRESVRTSCRSSHTGSVSCLSHRNCLLVLCSAHA